MKAARTLGEEYSLKAVSKAIHSQEAKHIFSFAPSWFKPMVEAAHKAVVREEKVLAEQRAKAAENPQPAPAQFQSPRPPFCPNGKSLLRKLSKVST